MTPIRMQAEGTKYRYRPWSATNPPLDPPGWNQNDSTYDNILPHEWPRQADNPYYWAQIVDASGGKCVLVAPDVCPPDAPAFFSHLGSTVEQCVSDGSGDYTWNHSLRRSIPSRDSSPWQSSDSSICGDTCNGAWSSPGAGGYSPEPRQRSISTQDNGWMDLAVGVEPCVSMSDVQHQPDIEPGYFAPGYQQPPCEQYPGPWPGEIHGAVDAPLEYSYGTTEYYTTQTVPEEAGEPVCSSEPPTTGSRTPEKRRQRSQLHSSTSTCSTVASTTSTQVVPLKFKTHSSRRQHGRSSKTATFLCPLARYGCPSSFISKNEWKRHINTQHLRLEAWQCDQCPQRKNRQNNFNRKDLFIQHLRRMHYPDPEARKPEAAHNKVKPGGDAGDDRTRSAKSSKADEADPALAAAERRCHQHLGAPPAQSACLFCSTEFAGTGSWEERIEHVAKHMEQDKKDGKPVPQPATWNSDRALEDWLVAKGVITQAKRGWKIAA